jgi:phage tail sheath gpL-like
MAIMFDNSGVGGTTETWKTLIIGHSMPNTPASLNTPYLVTSGDQADYLFGAGSLLAEQVRSYKLNDPYIETWAISIPEGSGSVAATTTITPVIAMGTDGKTPLTVSGTVSLYIAGKPVQVGISPTSSVKDVSTAISTQINSNPYLPCSSAVDANGLVTLTMDHKGTYANGTDISFNLFDETFPVGLTFKAPDFAGGTGNPDISAVFNSIKDTRYQGFLSPFSEQSNLKALSDILQTRWEPTLQNDGYAFHYCNKSIPDAISFASNLNSQNMSIINSGVIPTASYSFNAAVAAQCCASAAQDPAMPLKDLELIGVIVPPKFAQYSFAERTALLNAGISTYKCIGNSVYIERMVTTYKTNAAGIKDTSYLKTEKILTASKVREIFRTKFNSKYSRFKLAPDSQNIPVGQKILTPKIAKAELISIYRDLEEGGFVKNGDIFSANLSVTIDHNNSDKINVLLPVSIMSQLFSTNATIKFTE